MALRQSRQEAAPLKKPRAIGAKGLDRESVLALAIRIANEVGVNDLSLKRLAEEAGVAPPSIYTHFGSLAAVKRELTLRAYESLVRQATVEVLGKAGPDAISAVCYAYIEFARNSPGLHAALACKLDIDDLDIMGAAHAWVDLIYRLLAHYQLTFDESVHVMRALRSMLFGFASMELQGNFSVRDADRNESFRLMVESFIVGLQRYHGTTV